MPTVVTPLAGGIDLRTMWFMLDMLHVRVGEGFRFFRDVADTPDYAQWRPMAEEVATRFPEVGKALGELDASLARDPHRSGWPHWPSGSFAALGAAAIAAIGAIGGGALLVRRRRGPVAPVMASRGRPARVR